MWAGSRRVRVRAKMPLVAAVQFKNYCAEHAESKVHLFSQSLPYITTT